MMTSDKPEFGLWEVVDEELSEPLLQNELVAVPIVPIVASPKTNETQLRQNDDGAEYKKEMNALKNHVLPNLNTLWNDDGSVHDATAATITGSLEKSKVVGNCETSLHSKEHMHMADDHDHKSKGCLKSCTAMLKELEWGGGPNERTVLVVGETGAGKSTFINIAANFFRKGSLDKMRICVPTSVYRATEKGIRSTERALGRQFESQTEEVTRYRFQVGKKTLVLLDCPGFSDTRGHEQDELNLDKILSAAGSCVNMCAIVLLVNGKAPRYTLNVSSSMLKLKSYFPDLFFESLLVVFSRVKYPELNQFDLSMLPFTSDRTADENIFYMDNAAFNISMEKASAALRSDLAGNWDCCMAEFGRLVERISNMGVRNAQQFSTVKANRDEIKAVLHSVQLKIGTLQDVQEHIETARMLQSQGEMDQEKFRAFTKTTTVKETVLVDAAFHSTICQSCNHVCHNHCRLEEIDQFGDQKFLRCAAFAGHQGCQKCENGCGHDVHYHARKTVAVMDRTLEVVLEDIKEKYDQAVVRVATAKDQVQSLESARDSVRRAIDEEVVKVDRACREIMGLCSGFNLARELHITVQQLKHQKYMLTQLAAIDTANRFIRTVETIVEGLSATSCSGPADTTHKTQKGGSSAAASCCAAGAAGGKAKKGSGGSSAVKDSKLEQQLRIVKKNHTIPHFEERGAIQGNTASSLRIWDRMIISLSYL